jgi:hypothetical protein
MKPDDKPKKNEEAFEDPRLYTIIGDKVFPRPGLETVFVNPLDGSNSANSSADKSSDNDYFGTVVCSCNKVRVVSCGCVGYKPPRPSSSRSSGGGSRSGCRCAPVS